MLVKLEKRFMGLSCCVSCWIRDMMSGLEEEEEDMDGMVDMVMEDM